MSPTFSGECACSSVQPIAWDTPNRCARGSASASSQALDRAERTTSPEEERDARVAAVAHCGGDLLPDCYDEWVLPERLPQRHLDAL